VTFSAPSADGWVRAQTTGPGAEYPQVHPDGLVRFQLELATAGDVRVCPGGAPDSGLGAGPLPMTRTDDGVWTVTVGPVPPGLYYYWLEVDGTPVNDPGSRCYTGHGRAVSAIEVPGPADATAWYQLADVPHGDVRTRRHHTTGEHAGWRRSVIYTPPGYDEQPQRRYPVLYLQHGAGEDETGWVDQGRADLILDNLIAAGAAEPMIVVMTDGYAWPRLRRLARSPQRSRTIVDAFEHVLLHDLVPLVDSAYRTVPDAQHRALAGLSMGGRQALDIGLSNTEHFGWVGAFSPPPIEDLDPATSFRGALADPAGLDAALRLLWVGCGTGEARFVEWRDRLHGLLADLGVEHEVFSSEGTAHEWPTWRACLHAFAPLLFR